MKEGSLNGRQYTLLFSVFVFVPYVLNFSIGYHFFLIVFFKGYHRSLPSQ